MNRFFIVIIATLCYYNIGISQVGFNFDFDDCTYEDSGLMFPGITPGGNPRCECGLDANSIYLDGNDDFLTLSPLATILTDSNFTFDFYYQLAPSSGEVDIFSLRSGCDRLDSLMSFRYFNNTNELIFEMGSTISNYFSVRKKLDKTNCWHRFTLVKFGLEYLIYFDNQLVKKLLSKENIVFTRTGTLNFGNSPCIGTNATVRFKGNIDEITLHKRALSDLEILENFKYPDRIVTENTTIFKGDTLQINTGTSCATSINWTPAASLTDEMVAEPKAFPESSTTYTVTFTNTTCTSTDTVRIFVAEKDKLDCNALLLPKAFTPNNDGLNDEYGISNTFIVEKLDYFEIYNRWGAKVWETKRITDKWDGSLNQQPQNGGMYLYKIKYTCNGSDYVNVNNFMMLR